MKTILLTGVSRGLGLATANVLLEQGYKVIGLSRSDSSETRNLSQQYANFEFVKFDLENVKEIKSHLFDDILRDISIDGVVLNAAMAYDDIISNMDIDRVQQMFLVNTFSSMEISKQVVRRMILDSNFGSIIFISSISAHSGFKGLAMYAASKGALEAYSKNMAREWGFKGLRVNCVVPGFMETDMSASLTGDQKTKIYNRTSLRKPTDLISVSHTIEFLLSDNSSSITGQSIIVDGGSL